MNKRLTISLALPLAILLSGCGPSELEQQLESKNKSLSSEVENLKKQVSEAQAAQTKTDEEKSALETQLSEAQAALEAGQAKLAETEEKLASSESAAADLQKQHDETKTNAASTDWVNCVSRQVRAQYRLILLSVANRPMQPAQSCVPICAVHFWCNLTLRKAY